MNVGVHVYFYVVFFSGYIPGNRISGSHGSFIFHFLRNLHTVLHSGCTNLHFHHQGQRVLFSPYPLQHLVFVDFFEDNHLNWSEVISHCSFGLICISLIISNVEHFSCASWPSVCLWRNVYLGHLPRLWLGCFDGANPLVFMNYGD